MRWLISSSPTIRLCHVKCVAAKGLAGPAGRLAHNACSTACHTLKGNYLPGLHIRSYPGFDPYLIRNRMHIPISFGTQPRSVRICTTGLCWHCACNAGDHPVKPLSPRLEPCRYTLHMRDDNHPPLNNVQQSFTCCMFEFTGSQRAMMPLTRFSMPKPR